MKRAILFCAPRPENPHLLGKHETTLLQIQIWEKQKESREPLWKDGDLICQFFQKTKHYRYQFFVFDPNAVLTVLAPFLLVLWFLKKDGVEWKRLKSQNVQCHHRKERRKVSPSITPPPLLFKKRKRQKMQILGAIFWIPGYKNCNVFVW